MSKTRVVQGVSFKVGQRFHYVGHPDETYKLTGDKDGMGNPILVREANGSRWSFGIISGITNVSDMVPIDGSE